MKYKPSTSIKVLVAAALILPLGAPAHAYHEKQQSKKVLTERDLIDSEADYVEFKNSNEDRKSLDPKYTRTKKHQERDAHSPSWRKN